MSEQSRSILDWAIRAAAALIPLFLGALVTIAWQNSHALAVLAAQQESMRVDLERTKVSLEPGRTFSLRIDHVEAEVAHLRELVEQRLGQQPVPRNK